MPRIPPLARAPIKLPAAAANWDEALSELVERKRPLTPIEQAHYRALYDKEVADYRATFPDEPIEPPPEILSGGDPRTLGFDATPIKRPEFETPALDRFEMALRAFARLGRGPTAKESAMFSRLKKAAEKEYEALEKGVAGEAPKEPKKPPQKQSSLIPVAQRMAQRLNQGPQA